ncbi:alpha/beta fold hydrolase [Chondromyces crocatus]|uniref:AB hydrolase-1 domain-containing protein n=1 Tax=Chondromyces crocatus TaxID=52 RepID=A0A0K1ELP6_CHOCO|nr:alpha/beta hydrolase [Chondromyces crocatus]AKT41538.1 uncharacterized protein CMC5_057450 [Chondromyces crocatus]
MATSDPTIILVHGAFSDGSAWNKVIPHLHAKGLQVVSVQNPLLSLAEDVAAVNRAIALAEGKVILVGHSYGGAVITEAGEHDKVAALVFVAALAPAAGQSCADVMQGYPLSPCIMKATQDTHGFLYLPLKGMAEDYAQDVSAEEVRIMAATQCPIHGGCFEARVTRTAWAVKPSWYIVASEDRALPPDLLRALAQRMNARTVELPTSHVPQRSKPAEVAAVILEAANAVAR